MAAYLDRSRTAVSVTDELRLLATRVVGWKAPAEMLANETDVRCRVMARGTLQDINRIEDLFGATRLREAPSQAPPGVMDIRSWHSCHNRLGLGPAGPLPTRIFP